LLLTVLEVKKSKIQVQALSVSDESSLFTSVMGLSHCVTVLSLGGKGKQAAPFKPLFSRRPEGGICFVT
jgi:hypothetical protein